MSNYHRTEVLGRIGKDPEIRYLTNGDPVANFSVAVSESWTSKQTGEKVEKTVWYRCGVFGKLAEIIQKHSFKGQLVFVTGKMDSREYDDKEGVKRQVWELRVDEFKMLSWKDDGKRESDDHETGAERAERKAGTSQDQRNAQGAQRGSFDDMTDDIPFAPLGRGAMGHVI